MKNNWDNKVPNNIRNNYRQMARLNPSVTNNSSSMVQKSSKLAIMVNVINIAKVITTFENSSKIRAKILGLDDYIENEELPICIPLIPQVFSAMPKPGEMVYIICTNPWEPYYGRFWIGPVYDDEELNTTYEETKESFNNE
jgi:hypothetical protein